MKKLAVFIFAAILCVLAITIPSESVLELRGAKSVTFVVDANLAEEENLDFIQSGGDAIINVENEKIKEKYEKYAPKSVIFEFEKQKREYVEGFLSLDQTMIQRLNGLEIVYGYTSKFDKFEFVGGKKVNVMIVENDEHLLVGFPIIMTGF